MSSERSINEKNINKQNIPSLSFNKEEWTISDLGSISTVQDGTHSTPHYVEEGIPFFSVETITSDVPPKYISQEEHDNLIKRCKPKQNDILLTRIGTLCESKLITWDFDFSIYVSLALISDIQIYPEFLNQYIKTNYYKKEYIKRSLLLAVPQKINLKDLKETIVKFPSISEQKKIADFLDTIDRKIELMEKKYHQFIRFKKYLLQNFFKDTYQSYMFKKIFNESEFIKLGELANIQTGNKDLKDKKDDGKYPFFVRSEKIEHIDSYSFDGEAILIPGDGKIGEIYHYINGKFDYHQRVYKISNFENVIGKYVYYFLEENFLREAKRNTVKATVDSLRLSTITNMKIKIPHITIQNKIVEILSLTDNKISSLKNDIELNKEFKRSLLSKMFC